jgi:hypothetical protein
MTYIDNRKKILKMITLDDNYFYYCQVLMRRKEHPTLEKNATTLIEHYVATSRHWNDKLYSAINLATVTNSRVYIHLNRRDTYRVLLEINLEIAKLLVTGHIQAVRKIVSSIVGRNHSEKDKKWVVDIDWGDLTDEQLDLMLNKIKELLVKAKRSDELVLLPTKNGFHLITGPFNIDEFGKFLKTNDIPKVDIMKDNSPALLFIPCEMSQEERFKQFEKQYCKYYEE